MNQSWYVLCDGSCVDEADAARLVEGAVALDGLDVAADVDLLLGLHEAPRQAHHVPVLVVQRVVGEQGLQEKCNILNHY